MKQRSLLSRTFFILLTTITVIITSARIAPLNPAAASSERQVEFTPHITPLSLTQTAESLEIGPLLAATAVPIPTLGPGQVFERDDPNRPRLDPDTIIGYQGFGFAQLTENSKLYAVWITDGEGTHYLIVPHDSEVLTGGTNPDGGFFHLAPLLEPLFDQIKTAGDDRKEHHETANNFRVSTLVVGIVWGICVIATEGLCLALGGFGGGLFGGSMLKDNDAAIQQNAIDSLNRQLEDVERRMRGKFKIGQVLYGQR